MFKTKILLVAAAFSTFMTSAAFAQTAFVGNLDGVQMASAEEAQAAAFDCTMTIARDVESIITQNRTITSRDLVSQLAQTTFPLVRSARNAEQRLIHLDSLSWTSFERARGIAPSIPSIEGYVSFKAMKLRTGQVMNSISVTMWVPGAMRFSIDSSSMVDQSARSIYQSGKALRGLSPTSPESISYDMLCIAR